MPRCRYVYALWLPAMADEVWLQAHTVSGSRDIYAMPAKACGPSCMCMMDPHNHARSLCTKRGTQAGACLARERNWVASSKFWSISAQRASCLRPEPCLFFMPAFPAWLCVWACSTCCSWASTPSEGLAAGWEEPFEAWPTPEACEAGLEAAAAWLPLPWLLAAGAGLGAGAAAACPFPVVDAAPGGLLLLLLLLLGLVAVSSSTGGGDVGPGRLPESRGHTLGSCAVLLPTN